MDIQFTFRCRHCGGDEIMVPDSPADGDFVTCANCNAPLCTKVAFDERIEDATAEVAKEQLERLLEGKPGLQEPVVINLEF